MATGEHLDPTSEISLAAVKSRAVKGVVVLTGRTLVLQVISFIAQGFLWAFLSPAEFGVFFLVSAIINFLSYFSDIGLAAALIQKRQTPSDTDLKSTFFIQQTLVSAIIAMVLLLTPFFASKYSLTFDGKILLYALAFSFFLSSLKSIPSVLLERKLEFGKLVLPQVFEQLVYNVSLVFFAMKGFGITSFTFSVVIRSAVGLVAIYILQPWKPGIAISRKALSGLLKFGVPYQVNTFLATLKDDGMTLILGGILGPAGLGILGTAQKLAQYPLRFFMDNVTRVTFPAFSRMQDEKSVLERSVTRSIFFITFLVFPSIVGLVILAPIIIAVIPRYSKWAPALIPLAFVSINSMFAAVSTQLTNLLNAIGKIKITFFLMIMWTVLTWLFVPALTLKFGVSGAAVGYGLVGTSSGVAIYIARRFVRFSLTDAVVRPLAASAVMGISLVILRNFLPINIVSFGLLVGLGIVVYMASIYLMVGISIISDVKKILSLLIGK